MNPVDRMMWRAIIGGAILLAVFGILCIPAY